MEDWVFVDTCVWAAFFAKPKSPEKAAIDDLLNTDRVALLGPILAEVLVGFRRRDQADWVASRLQLSHCVEMVWADWRAAAHLGRELAARGNKLPLTDLVIATVANRCSCFVYTTDPHFDLIPNLKRFWPAK